MTTLHDKTEPPKPGAATAPRPDDVEVSLKVGA